MGGPLDGGPLVEAGRTPAAEPSARPVADTPARAPAARPASSKAPADPALFWNLGWALAAVVGACILVVTVAKPSMLGLLAMLIIGLPGLIGALWRPRGAETSGYLVIWAMAATMAATLEGGLGGPLAVWCVLPAIVTIVVEAPWALGVGLSMAALLAVAATNALHLAWRLPTHPLAFWLAFVAVLTTAAGAVGGLAVARRRANLAKGEVEAAKAEVEAELDSFQTLMGDLPELALAMDAGGRPHALFGRPLEGVDLDALHDGLVMVAEPADRARVQAALDDALAGGHAKVSFTPEGHGGQPGGLRLSAVIQRTTLGGLTAILREAPPTPARPAPAPAPVAAPVLAPPPAPLGETREVVLALQTKLKAAEAARQKAEADATGRARFLANMSHELRTPLNAIMGFSDIMRTRLFGDLQPRYQEYADLIHESGRHLLDLINDVLDMSKIEAHRFELSREVFDARDAVNAALRLMRLQADDAGVKLRGVLPTEPLEIDADRRALKQIVLNLVSNALKFTPSGGLITVTVERAMDDFDLTVADTGVGIAPEDLERLGRPYEQAGGAGDRAMGTGLGLSLVRSFAELHGGRMNIESRLGEGTAVTVRLPVLVRALGDAVEAEAGVAEAAVPEAPVEPAVAPAAEPALDAADARPVEAVETAIAPGTDASRPAMLVLSEPEPAVVRIDPKPGVPWPKVPPGGAPEVE